MVMMMVVMVAMVMMVMMVVTVVVERVVHQVMGVVMDDRRVRQGRDRSETDNHRRGDQQFLKHSLSP
jgi:hypothetical protein